MRRDTCAFILTGCLAALSASAEIKETQDGSGRPDKSIHETRQENGNARSSSRFSSSGISYHGGPLITNGVNVYYIWYGNWSGNTATTLLPALAQGLSGSPYFNINTSYYNGSKTNVLNQVNYMPAAYDNYSQGSTLTDAAVQAAVSLAISNGSLPADANGVYFVLTSADVAESSGFCTNYCGWHTYSTIANTNIKYAFVGNPDRCPSACEAQTTSPNGNAGADGMASIIAHELEEATTDPNLNAWYDSKGYENADKCAWNFGSYSRLPNGAAYNVTLAGYYWLIQENWVNSGTGYCALNY